MASMSAALFGGALVLTVSLQAGLAAQPVAALAGTPAAQALLLVPHRAVYDLSLDEKRGNSTVEGARGRIVYDFKGSRCEGYSLQFRQVTEMMANGATNTSDMRTTSFEDDAGEVFRFNVENFTNRHLDSEVEGQAERAQLVVELSQFGLGVAEIVGTHRVVVQRKPLAEPAPGSMAAFGTLADLNKS